MSPLTLQPRAGRGDKDKQSAEAQSREAWRGCGCDSQVAEKKGEGKIKAGEARMKESEEASPSNPAHGLE